MKKWIAALVLTHLFYCLAAQNEWQIKGMVRSETGTPLPGASVLLNDTMGTVTNAQGFYTLSVARKPRFLTARNVGFFAQRQILEIVRCKMPCHCPQTPPSG